MHTGVKAAFPYTAAFLAIFLAISLFVGSVPVAAQQSSAVLAAKVKLLEDQVRELQQRLNRGGVPDTQVIQQPAGDASTQVESSIVADLSARIGSLERQIRQLTGRFEEVDYRQRQMQNQIDQLQEQMLLTREQMLQVTSSAPTNAAEPSVGPGAAEPLDAPSTVSGPTQGNEPASADVVSLPDGSPTEQYNYAFSFIRRNDLDRGKIAMEKFLDANSDDESAANAKFWLGRINLQQGKPAEAARYYLSLIDDHPNHNRRPDALVDLADALVQIDAAPDACNALQEFRRVEDGASKRAKDSARRVDQAANCNIF